MSYYIKTASGISLIILAITSCHSQNTTTLDKHPVECIKLNDQGVKYLINYPINGEKGLDTAIALFKQAISCDSTNVISYNSLAAAYDHKHNYQGEMMALNKILALTANEPRILMEKGMLFEVMGNKNSAKEIYHLTEIEYKKRLTERPGNIQLIKGMILLHGVTGGKDKAIDELKQQIQAHPELSVDLSQEFLFYKDFNRHNFVFRLPTVIDLK